MLVIVGIVVVIGSIIGGYLLEHGNLLVLFQPAELVIIGGSAAGTVLIANPLSTVIKIVKGILGVLGGEKYSKDRYLECLRMLYELFQVARKGGMPALEGHIEEPEKSAVLTKYPEFLKEHHQVAFVCDTMRMAVTGGIDSFDIDQMMELDLEVHHRESNAPVAALTQMADSLPGLGIVAAVLGVVITMGALGGPPEEIGHKVAAALVGTFLGILLCYGFFGPVASMMAKKNDAEAEYYHCLRVAMISFIKGTPPIMAVEFARRSIPSRVRPGFKEVEDACRRGGQAQGA